MKTTYKIDLQKYMRLYLLVPPLMAYAVYGTALLTTEGLGFMLFCVAILHGLFYWRVRDGFAVVVGEDALELMSLTGQPERIAYTDLIGPIEKKMGLITYYQFMSAKNPMQKLVVTDYIENPQACLKQIAENQARISRSA